LVYVRFSHPECGDVEIVTTTNQLSFRIKQGIAELTADCDSRRLGLNVSPEYVGGSYRKDTLPQIHKKGRTITQLKSSLLIVKYPPHRNSIVQAAVE